MKIEYQDAGMEARLIVTSNIFERRLHTHIVDVLLLKLTQLNVTDEGFWIRTTIFTGPHAYVLCAETWLKESGFEVKISWGDK